MIESQGVPDTNGETCVWDGCDAAPTVARSVSVYVSDDGAAEVDVALCDAHDRMLMLGALTALRLEESHPEETT